METINHFKAKAAASIQQIEQALVQCKAEKILTNASYETGVLGLALFYCYYAKFTGNNNHFSKAEQYLEMGLDNLNHLDSFTKVYSTDSLDCHISNMGRFLEFAGKHGFIDIDTNSYLCGVDAILENLMISKIAISDFDLNSGALAAGYYFLSRYSSNAMVTAPLKILLKGIEEKALRDEEGYYYWTSPSLWNKVYFGISHGSAMIILFLANLWDKDIDRPLCEQIITKAVNFILKHKRTQEYGKFPLFLNDNEVKKPFCLCYGDVGVGYTLWQAARILNEDHLLKIAGEVLDSCLERKKAYNAPADAGIVYGASGLAALFEKLYLLSADQRYQQAGLYWYNEIPSFAIHNNEYAGYRTMLKDGNSLWNTSLGWGITGIGISLMRYCEPALPSFSELLMIA